MFTRKSQSSGKSRALLRFISSSLMLFLLVAGTTSAQTDQKAKHAAADRLFDEGLALANEGSKESLERAVLKLEDARRLYQLAGDPSKQAAALFTVGDIYERLGEIKKTIEYYSLSISLYHEAGQRRNEAAMLVNLGVVYNDLGEKQKALSNYDQALLIVREIHDKAGEAATLNNIGSVYEDLGEVEKALDYYTRALPLRRLLRDKAGEANTLNSLGVTYVSLEEFQKAVELFSQSLELQRAIGDRVGEAAALINLAGVYGKLGKQQLALKYYNEALPITREQADRRGEAEVLIGLGGEYTDLKEMPKALDYYEQALSLYRLIGNRAGEASVLNNIGIVHAKTGDLQKTLGYYNQALPLLQAIGDRPGEAVALANTANVEVGLGHFKEARAHIEAAITILESLRKNISNQDLRTLYFASVQGFYEFYIKLLMYLHQQRPAEGNDIEALQVSERARARVLLETLAEANADIRQGVDLKLVERERILQQRLNAKAQEQMKLPGRPETETQARDIAKEIEALTTEFQQVETEIRQTSPRYAALTQPQPLTLKEIQTQVLDTDTLLLEYSLGEDRSYLWAVTPNSMTSYELPKRNEIEASARRFYELLNARNKLIKDETKEQWQARVAQADAEIPLVAASLTRMVLAPVAGQLEKKRLVIVADGALQYIPFSALPVPSGNTAPIAPQPLIVEHEIVSLPSASTLAVIRREVAGRKPAPKTVVALADPVFAKNDERVKRRPGEASGVANPAPPRAESVKELQLVEASEDTGVANGELYVPRLLGSRKEAEEIVAMVPVAERKLALDFAASRDTATSAELSQYRYVHFSTHGFLDSVHPELSGIVFSLVNERGEAQDGFLRAHEVFNLKLPAEVVVLSACKTGIGKEVKGEGLVSLTRGFMYAGAPRVVVSLWSVSEMGTTELMVRFYREMIQKGKRPADALRAAQISLMQEKRWASPFYWAGFTLQGEWR